MFFTCLMRIHVSAPYIFVDSTQELYTLDCTITVIDIAVLVECYSAGSDSFMKILVLVFCYRCHIAYTYSTFSI